MVVVLMLNQFVKFNIFHIILLNNDKIAYMKISWTVWMWLLSQLYNWEIKQSLFGFILAFQMVNDALLNFRVVDSG